MQTSLFDQLYALLSNYLVAKGTSVVPLGLALQLCGIAIFLRGNLRDNQYARMSWVKALGTGVMFVVGMPLVSQTLSGVLIWLVPLGIGYVDILNLLALLSPIDADAASVSRPWGYLFAFLAIAGFVYRKIRVLKGRAPVRRDYIHIALVAGFSHVIFQLLTYAVRKLTH
jgi:hypothetical protein